MSELAIIAGWAFAIFTYYRGEKVGRHRTEQKFSAQQRIGYQKAIAAFDRLARREITEEDFRNPRYELFEPSDEDVMRWYRG
jgi:hypothetical protein